MLCVINRTQGDCLKAIKSHTQQFQICLSFWRKTTRHKSLFSAPTAHPERKAGTKNQYCWHCCRHHMHISMIMCRPWQWLHRPWLSTLLSSKIHRYQKLRACAQHRIHNVKAYLTHFIAIKVCSSDDGKINKNDMVLLHELYGSTLRKFHICRG